MLRLMLHCTAVLSLAALPSGAQPPTPQAKRPAPVRKHSVTKPTLPTAPPQQPTSIAPITPEQLPPVPPRVTYRNNVLTVESENSTLGAILAAIRQRTGAQIDNPPTGSNERVAGRFFGSPRQVLSSLLEGSGLGYAIISSPENPERVQKVILTVQARSVGQPGMGGSAPPNQQPAPPISENSPQDLSPEDEGPTPEQMNERFPPDRQAQPEMPSTQPPPTEQSAPQQQGPPQQPGPAQPFRTPEQLLQELQRLRNQRSK